MSDAPPSRERFDRLLRSPEYERLRERLMRIFARRGSDAPEELADETFARVVAKLPEIVDSYEGEPVRYVYGVARNVYLEDARRPKLTPYAPGLDARVPDEGASMERAHRCLDRCLSALAASERELIESYYLYDRSAKIDHRKELAERLGLGLNALRLKAFRIRQRLHRCVAACLDSTVSG